MSAVQEKRVIYDFGANTGGNIPYYLLKGDLVVAVEANPKLVSDINQRFADEIAAGRLIIVSAAVTNGETVDDCPFYVHKTDSVVSKLSAPTERPEEYDKISIRAVNVCEIVAEHGTPYFIKIDLEGYDPVVLDALFRAGIKPPFISAESHSIDVFANMLVLGGYRAFNLVDGLSVEQQYQNATIETQNGPARHSFPFHSAGPFGTDIVTPWMTPDNFAKYLVMTGFGWKDIHATTEIAADISAVPRLRDVFLGEIRRRFLNRSMRRR